MDDEATLRSTNEAFYKALETLDLEAMERLWMHESWVRCVHPGWDVLVGWAQIRESFEQIFASTRWIRVTPTGVYIKVFGDVAVVATSENITATSDGDVGVATAQATNIYLRRPEGWRMINHHASPAPVRVTQPFSGTIQ
jgi:uncharacterized protein (TIGR02246 family)